LHAHWSLFIIVRPDLIANHVSLCLVVSYSIYTSDGC
jgi:hypothetical protein